MKTKFRRKRKYKYPTKIFSFRTELTKEQQQLLDELIRNSNTTEILTKMMKEYLDNLINSKGHASQVIQDNLEMARTIVNGIDEAKE